MKNYLFLRWATACLLAGACFSPAYPQLQPAFQFLDMSAVTSGFLYAQAPQPFDPPDGTAYDALEADRSRQLFFNFKKSSILSTSVIPDLNTLRTALHTQAESSGCIPLAIMEMKYHSFVSDPVGSGILTISGDHYIKTPGNSQNPFTEKKTLVLLAEADAYHDPIVRFRLDASCYYQNYGSMPSLIRIDFGDGSGWKTITPGQVIQVNYGATDVDRVLKLEVTRSGAVKKTGGILKHNSCNSNFPSPIAPPWPVNNPSRPWEISTMVGGQTVKGNAYTLLSSDGVFDKPFIFVEGVDFGFDHGEHINGTFGWCQFTSGLGDANYDYSMLQNMPQLLNQVRSHGYDIVMLDFYDGA
ncbi:MAG: hypothetical protein IT223_06845, partial [Crocinitomicaceae bacterium]|nr:hypothetical protein [Crocinitomicaceae bacterium]